MIPLFLLHHPQKRHIPARPRRRGARAPRSVWPSTARSGGSTPARPPPAGPRARRGSPGPSPPRGSRPSSRTAGVGVGVGGVGGGGESDRSAGTRQTAWLRAFNHKVHPSIHPPYLRRLEHRRVVHRHGLPRAHPRLGHHGRLCSRHRRDRGVRWCCCCGGLRRRRHHRAIPGLGRGRGEGLWDGRRGVHASCCCRRRCGWCCDGGHRVGGVDSRRDGRRGLWGSGGGGRMLLSRCWCWCCRWCRRSHRGRRLLLLLRCGLLRYCGWGLGCRSGRGSVDRSSGCRGWGGGRLCRSSRRRWRWRRGRSVRVRIPVLGRRRAKPADDREKQERHE